MVRVRSDQIPCSSLIAEGTLRGAILGTIWGSVSDLEFLESLTGENAVQTQSRIIRRSHAIVWSASAFGLFIGVYSAGRCFTQRATGYDKDHWLPAFSGGFLGGGMFGVRSGNVSMCLVIGSVTGILAGLSKYSLSY